MKFSHDWFSRCWWILTFHSSMRVATLPTPGNGTGIKGSGLCFRWTRFWFALLWLHCRILDPGSGQIIIVLRQEVVVDKGNIAWCLTLDAWCVYTLKVRKNDAILSRGNCTLNTESNNGAAINGWSFEWIWNVLMWF